MTWIPLDDDFFNNPKIIVLSKSAKLLYISGLAYCKRNLIDGIICRRSLNNIAAEVQVRPITAKALVEAGLWLPHPDGYEIHDWLVHNLPAAEVRKRRAENAERMARNRNGLTTNSQRFDNVLTTFSPQSDEHFDSDFGFCKPKTATCAPARSSTVNPLEIEIENKLIREEDNFSLTNRSLIGEGALPPTPGDPISQVLAILEKMKPHFPGSYVKREWVEKAISTFDSEPVAVARVFADKSVLQGRRYKNLGQAFYNWMINADKKPHFRAELPENHPSRMIQPEPIIYVPSENEAFNQIKRYMIDRQLGGVPNLRYIIDLMQPVQEGNTLTLYLDRDQGYLDDMKVQKQLAKAADALLMDIEVLVVPTVNDSR